jgi:hypothetical protein
VYSAPPVYYGNTVPQAVPQPGYSQPGYSQPGYSQPGYESFPPRPPAAPLVDARLVQVQENLRRLGYYKGPVDGMVGTGTRNAIRAYQVDRGLPVTGRVDRELLQDLGL